MNRISQGLVLIGIAVASPVWAVSVPEKDPAATTPHGGVIPASLNSAESWTAGSASLVPLMAVEMEANHASYADAPANKGGGTAAKPVDDLAFVKMATESGRKEVAAARDALPQLKQPELKRIAEMLVTDHSGANERLAKIAEAKGWPVPAPQSAAPPPSGTASGDFDARWTAEMIAGHERSVALYTAQSQRGEDKDLRKYAHDTLPTIEHHLAELRRLQK
jgi:putative membrane protein